MSSLSLTYKTGFKIRYLYYGQTTEIQLLIWKQRLKIEFTVFSLFVPNLYN